MNKYLIAVWDYDDEHETRRIFRSDDFDELMNCVEVFRKQYGDRTRFAMYVYDGNMYILNETNRH